MERKRIVLSEIKNLMKVEGKTRKEIEAIYQLNPLEAKALWKQEALKNIKPAKYTIGVEFVDDITVDYGDLPANRHGYVNGPIADSSKSFE